MGVAAHLQTGSRHLQAAAIHLSAVAAPPVDRAAYLRELVAGGDPVERIQILNGFQPWSKQREIIRALYDHKRVAVQSSHGVGKTAVAAAIIQGFMRQGPCRIVTTAPTWFQVETLLWAQIRLQARNAKVPWGKQPGRSSWKVRDDWAAFGLSPDEPERFQGHHGRRVLLVVDEASGVDDKIFEAGQGFLTGEQSYVLLISNPTKTSGAFFRACQPDSPYAHIKINTFDTPFFTGERFEGWEDRPAQQYVDDMRRDWGEDSPQYQVRVMGEFADMVGRPYFQRSHYQRVETLPPKRRGYLVGDPVAGSQITFREDAAGDLRIWSAPVKGRRYLVFADVAGQVRLDDWKVREETTRGSGYDYCAACVLDVDSGVQVAELHGQMDPDVYGRALARLAYVYASSDGTPAWLGVESNNMGQATLGELKHLKFRRLWRRQRLENARPSVAPALGLVTTRDSKERILAALQTVLRQHPSLIKSEWLLNEIKSFQYHENGYGGAAPGAHDDRVIAAAGAFDMRDQVLRRPGSDEARAAA